MIGKVIKSLLESSAGLMALVPTAKIFPYVLNEDTALPAIVYTIDGIKPQYDKEDWCNDIITFSVTSLSSNYGTLQSVVAQVRLALDFIKGTSDGITFGRIHIESLQEGYNMEQDVYANKLTFNVKIISY